MNYDGDGIFSYQVTIPAGTPDSPLTFDITATDDAMNTGEGEATLIVVDPDSIYVDNPAAQFVCNWGTSPSGGYNDDYRWHGSCTATWTPNIVQAGDYDVYAWWKSSVNRATNAKYTIYYNGGSQSVEVNQEINDSQWNLLGNFPFAEGILGYVELTNEGADEYVIADAVGWDFDSDGTPDIIIDISDPEFDSVGDWTCTSGSGGYEDDYCWAAGDGSCTATWRPDISQADTYNVYAWWKASPNRATDAKYTIYYDGGSETHVVEVDQEINGGKWNELTELSGPLPFAAGTSGYVVLSDDANDYVIADAIKWEPEPLP
jgi:hypothetical protein